METILGIKFNLIIIFFTMLFQSAYTGRQKIKDLKRTDSLQLIHDAVGNTPPNFNDDYPTTVECELYVDSFDSINEVNMDFTVGVLLHLSWVDERFLPWAPSSEDGTYLEFDSKNLENFWVPDIFFPNEKKAYFHDVFFMNKMLRVYSGGRVSYTARMTLVLNCQMDLRNYPFDKQQCCIEMESFSYNVLNVIMKWVNESVASTPVETKKGVELPQFRLKDISYNESTRIRKGSGKHSTLKAIFYFERNIGYYLVQMYIPSILVVMLSWISFWLNVNSVPGRISLGVLTVLTMSQQGSAVSASLPRVSYIKAIDIWMSICLLFVFSALIEFAIANVLSRLDTNKGFKFTNVFLITTPDSKKKKKKNTELLVADDGEMKLDPESDPTLQRPKKKMRGIVIAMYFDVACRFLFPFLFGFFNLVYWTIYTSNDHNSDNINSC